MGRQPKKIEDMRTEIHRFMWLMMQIGFDENWVTIDEPNLYRKDDDLDSSMLHINIKQMRDKLQNDFTPEERRVIHGLTFKNQKE